MRKLLNRHSFRIGDLNYNQFVASPVVDWSSLVRGLVRWVGSFGWFVGLVRWLVIHG
ncbi:MAG: hypothetical protein ACPGWR_06555 [Ardenticatenaceae bacterium]